MKRMAVYVMRVSARCHNLSVDIPTFIISYILSIFLVLSIASVPPISYIFLLFVNPTIKIYILLILIFSFSIFFYSICVYFDFVKPVKKMWRHALFYAAAFVAAVVVLVISCIYGWESEEPLLEVFGIISFWISLILAMTMFLTLVMIVRGLIFGHRINTHFKNACRKIDYLRNIQNKNIYTLYSVSEEYGSGIKEIKNLLIRGIDLDWVFDSKTELSLNEILDWLTFSMQYYLFCGGPEQMEAVKNHLKCMIENFDGEYRINADQFMHEILRMYNEINIYFKENNIYIARSTKLADRIISHMPQVLLAIALLVISIITKDFIIN